MTDEADDGDEGDWADDDRAAGPPPPPPDPEPELPPSRMRGSESLYGYVVGAELLVVAILNLVVRSGPDAPAHPGTVLEVIAVVAALAFFAVLQTRNRTVVGLGAIVGAFFVTIPKVPNSLAAPHILALVVPLVYGLVLTQRQRRAIGKTVRERRRGAARRSSADRSPDAERGRTDRSRRDRGRGGRAAPTASGARPNGRYTPPKTKRSGTRPGR